MQSQPGPMDPGWENPWPEIPPPAAPTTSAATPTRPTGVKWWQYERTPRKKRTRRDWAIIALGTAVIVVVTNHGSLFGHHGSSGSSASSNAVANFCTDFQTFWGYVKNADYANIQSFAPTIGAAAAAAGDPYQRDYQDLLAIADKYGTPDYSALAVNVDAQAIGVQCHHPVG